MVAYIQTDSTGNFYNVNAYLANEGFTKLGWHTIPYHTLDQIEKLVSEEVVVGGIGYIKQRLAQLGIPHLQQDLDYPPELRSYLGRKIWDSTLEEVFRHPEQWNLFMKPKQDTKKFTGKIFSTFKDFIGLMNQEKPTPVICSEILPFRTEWRCFVRYGSILDIRRYKGDWDNKIDLSVVQSAITAFQSAPAAYGIDFGLAADGKTYLVEVNDGHSLGTYGIGAINYAKFLSARWAELTNTRDYNDF